jgi:uncharacterized surface protein with fasciclin (FAS1) repeats
MTFQALWLAALAAPASALLNLTATLANQTDLSNLTSFISYLQPVLSVLSSATNITILAPSNQAFTSYLNSSASTALANNNTALVDALLDYHVIRGTYNASTITKQASFLHTDLTTSRYANVSNGQVVEGIVIGSNVTFFSGLLANSTVTTAVCRFPTLECR